MPEINTLYPNEKQLTEFIVREIRKDFDTTGLFSKDNPSVVLAYHLHRFFTVLRETNIKLTFREQGKRVLFPEFHLVHLKVLQTLLSGYGVRTSITPLETTVTDALRVLSILSIVLVPPPNLVF